MKKRLVLIVLFVLPLVAYLFFSSGSYNFANLPTITPQIEGVKAFQTDELKVENLNALTALTLDNRITILGYLGDGLKNNLGYTANLNLMIYKYFERYEDFQMVFFINPGSREAVAGMKEELSRITDVSKIRFIEATGESVAQHFKSLGTSLNLMPDFGHPNVFLIDKKLALRGRDDEKKQNGYGYDFTQAVEMGYIKDDVKILLAEYRLALKKNDNASPELEQRRPIKQE